MGHPIFGRICRAIGRPELVEDPRFANNAAHISHLEALDAILVAWCSSLPFTEIAARLNREEVAFSKVYSIADVASDPQFSGPRGADRTAESGPGRDPRARVGAAVHGSRDADAERWARHGAHKRAGLRAARHRRAGVGSAAAARRRLSERASDYRKSRLTELLARRPSNGVRSSRCPAIRLRTSPSRCHVPRTGRSRDAARARAVARARSSSSSPAPFPSHPRER